MGEKLKQSGSFYQEEDTVKGIYINVFFHEDHQKYEIELSRKNGEEGEQPLPIIISNDYEEGKNIELAQKFFKEAVKLAQEGRSLQEIFEVLEKKRDTNEEVNTVVDDGKKEIEKVVYGEKEKKSHWLETKFLGENPSDEDILNYLYKLIYGVETDKRIKNFIISFARRYPQANGEILRLVYDIGRKGEITSIGLSDYLGRKKASFFLFMLHFTDLAASIIDDIDEDSNLETFLQGYFKNNTLLSDDEQAGNLSSYQWKLPTLRYYGIGDKNVTTIGIFNKIIKEKYDEFIKKVLILNEPKEKLAKLILQKFGNQDIPEHSPIFGAIVQLLQGKKFENISMGGFEELENGVLENSMKNYGIPITIEGLEKFLINEDKHEKEEEDKSISFYSIP
ncbi:hypothetical protein HGA92_03825 [Candidatus Gracilibacteria bacterium]|nr:hypothetical protein [Candidatus Gracilibacteria bacterium]NUJ99227.1 hypothetical protein [Candidatus Gracilibacteria bacterium]